MNGEFIDALEQLQKEKDIPMASLIQTVEAAMQSAYRKHFGASEEVRLEVDPVARTVRMIARKPILPEGVAEALANADGDPDASVPTLDATYEAGLHPEAIEYEEHEVDASEFGRIAAQTAKQVVMQRIREAEREIVYDEFSHRVGEVVTGEVQRRDARNVFVALGRVEALLPAHEQIPGEPYRFNDRIKVYILDVRRTTKNPQIIISRTHPNLVLRLFELEVPERSGRLLGSRVQGRRSRSCPPIRRSIRWGRAWDIEARAFRRSWTSCAARRSTSYGSMTTSRTTCAAPCRRRR